MGSTSLRLFLMLALVAGSSVFTAAPASAKPDRVIKATDGDKWKPQHAYVRRGGDGKAVVKWKNPTGTRHDIKSTNEGKDWYLKYTVLNKGDGKTKTFKKNGNYYFRCTIHSVKQSGSFTGMVGILHVRK